jgi:hypothetical protein
MGKLPDCGTGRIIVSNIEGIGASRYGNLSLV